MRYLANLLFFTVLVSELLLPFSAYAAYGLTHSATLVSATPNYFSAAASASLETTGALTIEVWVKFTTLNATNQLFDNRSTATGQSGYDFYVNHTNNQINLDMTNGSGGGVSALVSWTPSTGTWYHVAVTVNGSNNNTNFYVNGVQQGTTQTGFAYTSNTSDKTLGVAVDHTQASNAEISLMRVWNTERSQGQISANMCSVLGSTAGLNAEWTLNNTVNDNSGNNNTLTNVNSVAFTTDLPATCATTATFNIWALIPF
jgi:hypothetical protein